MILHFLFGTVVGLILGLLFGRSIWAQVKTTVDKAQQTQPNQQTTKP